MFEQSFKNIDDILHKDAGCGSELDYVEQTDVSPKIRTGKLRLKSLEYSLTKGVIKWGFKGHLSF